jgi:hypothetical protein
VVLFGLLVMDWVCVMWMCKLLACACVFVYEGLYSSTDPLACEVPQSAELPVGFCWVAAVVVPAACLYEGR